MIVRYAFKRVQQGADGRFGLLRVAAEFLRQVAFHAFAQGQEFTQRIGVALVELAQVQGRIASAFDLVRGAVQIKDELRRDDTDQHQHDQADAFLAIVGTVHEAHGHGRDHQNETVPERWVLLVVDLAALFRCLVHLRQRTPPLQADQDQRGDQEAGHWREHQ
ncbi:hypothetical protein D3C73_293250 [compost metagenome]